MIILTRRWYWVWSTGTVRSRRPSSGSSRSICSNTKRLSTSAFSPPCACARASEGSRGAFLSVERAAASADAQPLQLRGWGNL
jgi:hypothetical protein